MTASDSPSDDHQQPGRSPAVAKPDDPDRWLAPARLACFTPIREYPPLGDRKATALLAGYGLMVTVLLFFAAPIEDQIERGARWEAAVMVAVLLPLAGSWLAGGWYAIRALMLPIPPMPRSLAFFREIAAMSREQYLEAVHQADFAQVVRSLLDYNYSVATLCVAKFDLVGRSIACSRATFKLWMLLLLCLAAFEP